MTSAVSSSSFSARSGATVRAELRKTRSYGLVRTATAFLAIIPFVAIAVWQYASGSGSAAGAATAAATTQLRLLSSNASSNGTLVPGEHCRIPLVADPAQITHPAGSILYLIGVAFAFVGISIVCEEHFAKALEEIIDKMDSEYFAGRLPWSASFFSPLLRHHHSPTYPLPLDHLHLRCHVSISNNSVCRPCCRLDPRSWIFRPRVCGGNAFHVCRGYELCWDGNHLGQCGVVSNWVCAVDLFTLHR